MGNRPGDRQWVTVSEAAERTGYSRKHIQNLASSNATLPIGEQNIRVDQTSDRGYLIYMPSLWEYIENQGRGAYTKRNSN
jgi:hypothetical protein